MYSCSQDNVSPDGGNGQGTSPNGLTSVNDQVERPKVITGAEVLINEELDRIKDKRIAIVANHTSLV